MPSDAIRSGYRFNDLKRSRIVSSRGDLHEKQKKHGFPKPAKFGERAAWWPAEEVNAWIETRLDLRGNPGISNDESATASAPPAKSKPRKSKETREIA